MNAARLELVRERVNRGLSIREASRQMEISEQSLRRAEGGEGVTAKVAFRIASFYEKKVTDLWPLRVADEVSSLVGGNGDKAA